MVEEALTEPSRVIMFLVLLVLQSGLLTTLDLLLTEILTQVQQLRRLLLEVSVLTTSMVRMVLTDLQQQELTTTGKMSRVTPQLLPTCSAYASQKKL